MDKFVTFLCYQLLCKHIRQKMYQEFKNVSSCLAKIFHNFFCTINQKTVNISTKKKQLYSWYHTRLLHENIET